MAKAAQGGGSSAQLSKVAFDGAAVWGSWTGGNSATPFVLALFEDGAELQRTEVTYGPQSAGPFSARLAVGPRLDPERSYEVGVSRGAGPEDFGALLPIIVAAPVLVSLDYDGKRIHVIAEPPRGTGETLVVTLWADGHEIARAAGSATETTLELSKPLVAWRKLTVRLHHETSSSIGRMGGPIALVVDAPLVTHTDYDGARVRVRWAHPSGGRAPLGGKIALRVDGSITAGAGATGNDGSVEASLDASKTATAAVRATRGPVIGPESAPAVVIAAQRTPAEVRCDGSSVDVSLAGELDAGVTGFELELLADGVTVATAAAGKTGGTLQAPFVPGRIYAVAVRAIGEGCRGRLGPQASVITTAPHPRAIVTTGRTVEVTVGELPAGATSRTAVLLRGNVEVARATGAGPTLALTPEQDAEAGAAYVVRLQAHAEGNSKLVGSVGEPIPVVVHAPRITEARWDGSRVHVSWQPAAQVGLVGYTVELHASDSSPTTAPVSTHETQAVLEFSSPTAGAVYTVTVRARTSLSIGPAQSAPAVVAMRPRPAAWFISSPAMEGARVVFRADPRAASVPAPSQQPLTFLLPRLFAGSFDTVRQKHTGELTEFGVQAGGAHCFGLDLSGVEARPWKLVIDPTQLPTSTAELRKRLDDFLTVLETAPAGTLQDGALVLVRQVIARGAPLSFDQILLCAYGLDVERRSADLMPGMRLRIDPTIWQLVPPDPTVGSALSGYTPAGSVFYELEGGGGSAAEVAGRTGVNAFLSRMSSGASEARDRQTDVDTGLGGSVDLLQQRLRRPWLRLVYPTTFVAGNERGSIGIAGQVALVAEDSYAKLVATAKDVADLSPGNHGAVTFFRGRAALIPEICVTVDGQPRWVAVGTTVRQLLTSEHGVPLRPGDGDTTPPLAGISMTRSLGAVVERTDDLAGGERFGRHEPVRIGGAAGAGAGPDRFDLPLLHGDRLSTSAAGG